MIYRRRGSVYDAYVMSWSEFFRLMVYVVCMLVFLYACYLFLFGFFMRIFLFAFSCGEKAWLLVTWPVRRLFALLRPREKKSNKEVEIFWDDEDEDF